MNLADKHNAAAMREALKTVKRYFDGYTVNVPEMRRLVDASLAAPARNCDAHTADELKVKFSCELVSELPIANEHEKNLVTITAMGVIDTLFATTQEGGAK